MTFWLAQWVLKKQDERFPKALRKRYGLNKRKKKGLPKPEA